MTSMESRVKIPYKFAIGLALKNNEELLAKDICKFILVHMPRICTLKNKNWENAVRSNLTIHDCFVRREVILEQGKPLNYYRFADGVREKFEKEYSFEFGFPYDFLAKPENHAKIYKGEIGFPTEEEVRLARAWFEQEKERYALLNKENDDRGKKQAKKGKKSKNEDMKEVAVASGENQMASYDFGNYQQNVAGPTRTEVHSNSCSRMAPYHRESPVLQGQPMMEQSLPSISSFFQPTDPLQQIVEDVELFSSPTPLNQQEGYQEYLQLVNAPLPPMDDADYALYAKYFPTSPSTAMENSTPNSPSSYDNDFAYCFSI